MVTEYSVAKEIPLLPLIKLIVAYLNNEWRTGDHIPIQCPYLDCSWLDLH